DLRHLDPIAGTAIPGKIYNAAAIGPQFLADGEGDDVPQAAADECHGFVAGDVGGRTGRPHEEYCFPRLQVAAEAAGAAGLEDDEGDDVAAHTAAGEGEAFHPR